MEIKLISTGDRIVNVGGARRMPGPGKPLTVGANSTAKALVQRGFAEYAETPEEPAPVVVVPFAQMKRDELRAIGKDRGIEGATQMTKKKLLEALR